MGDGELEHCSHRLPWPERPAATRPVPGGGAYPGFTGDFHGGGCLLDVTDHLRQRFVRGDDPGGGPGLLVVGGTAAGE